MAGYEKAREAKPDGDDPFASDSAEPKNKAAKGAAGSPRAPNPDNTNALLKNKGAKGAARPPVRRTGVEAIEAALAEPIDCEFVETPLKDVIDYLEDAAHVKIYVDSSGLKQAGIDESTPITCNLHGLRLENVLRLVLNELKLGWTIHDDVLYVTSQEELLSDEFVVIRVYDVGDLVVYQDNNGKKFDDFVR